MTRTHSNFDLVADLNVLAEKAEKPEDAVNIMKQYEEGKGRE